MIQRQELAAIAARILKTIDRKSYQIKGHPIWTDDDEYQLLDVQSNGNMLDVYVERADGIKARFHVTVEPAPIQPGCHTAGS